MSTVCTQARIGKYDHEWVWDGPHGSERCVWCEEYRCLGRDKVAGRCDASYPAESEKGLCVGCEVAVMPPRSRAYASQYATDDGRVRGRVA